MAMLTSAFAYLGSYYAEANPSLQGSLQATLFILSDSEGYAGQTLYTKGDKQSLSALDKQIYRLIGKATTLAACACFILALISFKLFTRMAYRVRQGRDFVIPPTGLSYTGS